MKRVVLSATASLVLPASVALAQDDDRGLRFAAGPATFTLTGQLNQGILFYDDGEGSEAYGSVDNDNSSSRLNLSFEAELSETATLGGTLEFKYQPYASDAVSQEGRGDPDFGVQDDDYRKAELFLETGAGTFWLGQGDMASNETAEVDLSGTTVAANSDLEDVGGAQLFRLADGSLSEVSVDDAFDNLDGLSRIVRVRYDAPSLLDDRLTFSASYGQDRIADERTPQRDVAAFYEDEGEVLTVGAAAAYGWEGEDTTILDGSLSVLHEPTGLSATLAGGRQREEGEEDAQGGYGTLKLGYEADLIEAGSTALSVDAFRSGDRPEEGSEGTSYGLAVVQAVEAIGTEVYLAVRSYEYDDDAGGYGDATAVLVGARVRF